MNTINQVNKDSNEVKIEDYKYVGTIGDGFFSIVKKYVHLETGDIVAVKELKGAHYENNDYKYRFIREIKLLIELSGNEHIIDLLGSGNLIDERKLYYIMPLAKMNLYKFIKTNNNNLSEEKRISLFDQILDAIHFSHEKSILHRDIAPNNILIFEINGEIILKVSDFGLGKDINSLSFYTHSSTSRYGQILYISPQQREMLKDATFSDDIYSLGKLLYFITTGKDPIDIQPCNFSTIIDRATDEDSSKRYQKMNEFKEHFESLKKLILTNEIPEKNLVIKDFINITENINWFIFHQLATEANEVNHIYYDYIDPIVELFSDISNILLIMKQLANQSKNLLLYLLISYMIVIQQLDGLLKRWIVLDMYYIIYILQFMITKQSYYVCTKFGI